ncbi:MAG: hypothetical protein CSB48_13990 [Proteobacteria bacterium]|nr:MAG: hypothetical protein CSB48_13990 [Pseudomonadota bacterium]
MTEDEMMVEMANMTKTAKRVQTCCILIVLALVGGCASVSPLMIDEAMLESHFRTAVAKYDHQQLAEGSPVGLMLNEVDVKIGPGGREVIQMKLDGELSVNAMLVTIPVRLMLSLEAVPVYVKEDKAIYIRRLKLLDSAVESSAFDGLNLDKTATRNAVRILSSLLEKIPVYRLDESNYAEAIIASSPLRMKIAQGRLVFALENQ